MRPLVFLCLLASATAHAQLTTIDAQDHPTGTNLMYVQPGAKLSTVHNRGTGDAYLVRPVFALANSWATGVGPNLFGHDLTPPTLTSTDFRNLNGLQLCLGGDPGDCDEDSWAGSFNPLRVSFSVPTDYVEVRAHFRKDDIDGADLRAYNIQGELLATCHFYGDVPLKNPKYKPTATSPDCGELVRRYECNSSGSHCKSEHLGRIKRKYPDIAYVLYGGEAESATGAYASQITFRRFSDGCSR
jgi:hypothetical protein